MVRYLRYFIKSSTIGSYDGVGQYYHIEISSEPCPAGSYKDSSMTECKPCPDNTYSTASAGLCTPCPQGSRASNDNIRCGKYLVLLLSISRDVI